MTSTCKLPARRGARTLAAALLALMAACSGGDNGGIDGTGASEGVSYGTITGFGSVWVNGVRFDTAGATIRLDDGVVAQSALQIGMVVRVDGSIDNATARTITVDSAVKGRIEQVVDAGSFVVMGQRVFVDNQTRFESVFTPAVGDFVEVHGLPTRGGEITAGFVQKRSTLPTPPFAAKGFVSAHDTTNRRFTVGTLVVDYAGASVNDLPATGTWDGRIVEVRGNACAGPAPVCGTLTATKVEPTGAALGNATKAEVEGFVSALTSNGFTLGATPVVLTAATVFEGGAVGDIAPGTKLEVEGRVQNGTLTATTVEFRDNVRLRGTLAAVDTLAGVLTVAGLPNVPVRVGAVTRFENVANLAALVVGQGVEIEARAGAGDVLATEIKAESSAGERVELQGPVSAIAGTASVTVQGTVIATAGITEYRNLADAPVDRDTFFAALRVGTLVKARGTLAGGNAVLWSRLELED